MEESCVKPRHFAEHSKNAKDTRQKKGTEPPNVTLDYIINDLCFYFKCSLYTKQTEKEIERKYSIETEDTGFWPIDDIKQAWGKTQQMEKNERRKLWSLVIMLQIIQRKEISAYDESTETQSITTEDLTTSHDLFEESTSLSDCAESINDHLPTNRTWPFEKALTVRKVGKRTTLNKRGTAPPKINLRELSQNLSFYVSQNTDLIKAKKATEKKYEIKKLENDSWPFTDIQRAWGKTQRITDKKRKDAWTTVIMSQVMKTYERKLFQSTQALNKTCTTHAQDQQECQPKGDRSELNDNIEDITGSITRKYNVREKSGDSDSMCSPKMRQCHTSTIPHSLTNAESIADEQLDSLSEESTPHQLEQVAVNKSKDATSFFNRKHSIEPKKLCNGAESINVQLHPKRTGERGPKMRHYLSCPDFETTCIRIPLSIINAESVADEQSVSLSEERNTTPVEYKLIDRVPSLVQTMRKTSYVVQYNNQTRNPAWVFEILNKETLMNIKHKTKYKFRNDDMIQGCYKTSSNSYGEDYDRGHMAAAANHVWSTKAKKDTFLLTNVAPQVKNLNQGIWRYLEMYCRNQTDDPMCKNIYVYTGPLYWPDDQGELQYKIIRQKAVPTHFFKVIVPEKYDGTRTLECYVMPNEKKKLCRSTSEGDIIKVLKNQKTNLHPYKEDLKFIEKASGLLFHEKFPALRGYRETIVDVHWSAEENRHASAEVEIFTHPVIH